jgi:hypothetical protein
MLLHACTRVQRSQPASAKWCMVAQDKLAAKHLTNKDYLIVSVGGNDVALSPTPGTIVSMRR